MTENTSLRDSNFKQYLRGALFVIFAYAISRVLYSFIILPLSTHIHHRAPVVSTSQSPENPVSVTALRGAIEHFRSRGPAALAYLRGCFSAFLSVEMVLTYD